MAENSTPLSKYTRPVRSKIIGSVVLSALSLFVGCSSDSDDDDDNSSNLRTDACDVLGLKIINGTECRSQGSPVVSYDVYYTDRGPTSCSGTMISATDILTAAHCFDGFGTTVSEIRASFGGTVRTAAAFGIHPQYSEESANVPGGVLLFNDVAVVRVNDAPQVPILPLITSRGVASGDIVSIFGYGLDENGSAGTLRSGEMQIDSNLGNQWSAEFNGDGSNTCQGDSGGPALYTLNGQPGIVGITSSGDPSTACLKGDLSIFANIQDTSILDFILSITPGAGRI